MNFNNYTFNKDGSILGPSGKKLSYHKCKKGYNRVNLKNDKGKKRTYLVHRIIAKHFIPNPFNKPQINHIDGDKNNNSVKNLEWCTSQENVAHSVKLFLVKRGSDRPNSKLTDEQVKEVRSLRVLGLNYYQLGRKFNIAYQTAHKICTRKIYTHI